MATKTHREIVNHQAYEDVLSVLPAQSSDKEYLECYHAWCNIVGPQHFDPHCDEEVW